MRLSEKTLELSVTSQITHRLNIPHAIWFGLTQKQEKALGFDVASNVSGKLLVFQFKASNVIVHPTRYSNPRRKFSIPHAQLVNLQALAKTFPESVFYVFPNIGTTEELALNADLASQSWLLNVAGLPTPFPDPTNSSQTHHAFIEPPFCDIRSAPVETKLVQVDQIAEVLPSLEPNSRRMVGWLREHDFTFKGMKAYGLLIP